LGVVGGMWVLKGNGTTKADHPYIISISEHCRINQIKSSVFIYDYYLRKKILSFKGLKD
jgi:hypothetical protein